MKPLAMAIDDEIRLYTTPTRAPVDVVAPEHLMLHADLERWGQWNREGRPSGGTCNSIEGNMTSESGGRETRAPQVSLPPDPLMARIERAVVLMIGDPVAGQYGETLREFYCKRWAAKTICWAHGLQYEGYSRWLWLCRETVRKSLEGEGHGHSGT